MLLVLQKSFEQGQKAGIIVRAEGAPVSTTFLKETISVLLEPKREVRETVLGHLQRGGNPTVFERTLATRMGVQAIQLLDTISQEPRLVKLNAKKIGSAPLIKSLTKIKTLAFQEGLSTNTNTALHLSKALEMPPEEKSRGMRIGLLTDGTNVSGMNMAIRSVARLALNRGIAVKGIKGGFSGLSKGPESVVHLQWSMLEMKSILRRAGTLLGVSSSGFPLDEKWYKVIKQQVKQLKIDGLIVIGNTTTYRTAHKLSSLINTPVVGIPAASHCNLPETDWVIGMDSTLNDLLQGIDRAADAAHVTRKIFILHLKGAFCNCLVKLVALAGGAEQVLIYEHATNPAGQQAFQKKVRNSMNELKKMIALGKTFGTIVFYSHHPATADQTVQSIKQSLHRAGIPLETTIIPLETSLGGITPTAFDRILAKRLGEKALETVLKKIADRDHSFQIVGIKGKEIVVPPYKDSFDKDTASCSSNLETELERCFDLMAQPSGLCIGMGGKVQWIATNNETKWRGKWICNTCGHSQTFFFNPRHMLCLYCKSSTCQNYGYIRISRRL
jgi:6-phosphofructokinase 1